MLVGERPGGGVASPVRAEVRVLGGFDVTLGRRTVSHADWQRLSAERLFKLLVVTPGHRVARELAAETLWPDSPPDTERANLRKAIHFAHRALRGSDVLSIDARSVGLDPASLSLDLDRLVGAFEVLRERHRSAAEATPRPGPAGPPSAREGDLRNASTHVPRDDAVHADHEHALETEASRALETVLELGPKELLPEDQYEDWLVGPRERLRSQWQRMAIVAAQEADAVGRSDQAHEIVDQVLDRDPTDESAHRLAIRLYASEGRHHAARRQFERCRAALREVLDVEPSAETTAAYRAAENQASSGDPRVPAMPGLVARRSELEQIEALFDRVGEGRLACLVIRGPAGIGKTRLAEEVAAYGRSAGWQVITWRAVEALRAEAFAPLRIALAGRLTADEIAGWPEPARSGILTLVPALDGGRLTFQDRPSLVAALVAALDAMARRQPIVLVIDDLPWLDESSLALLAALVAGREASAILVAATFRDDEPASPEVRAFLDQMRRANGLDLGLGPLARRDVEPLVVGHLGGASLDPELSQRLFELGGGNPLFSLELVRAGIEHSVVRQRDGRWELAPRGTLTELPASARRIAARRTATLPPAARHLLAIAAELGADLSFDVLTAVVGDAGRVVEALDAALQSGLLVEAGAGYAFAHPMYRVAVRRASGPARRAGTHLAIARALAGTGVTDQDPAAIEGLARSSADPVSVAEHALSAAELGTREAIPLAVAFGFAAGDRLVRLHDRDAAASVLRRAVTVWHRLPEADARGYRATEAFIDLARLAPDDDELGEASTRFREAIAAARDAAELALAYDAFWEWVPYRRGDFERGLALIDEALARLPASEVVARAHVQAMLGWTLVRLHRPAEALPILEEAARRVEPSSDVPGALRALDSLGMTLHYLGRSDEGRPYVERALALALEAGNTSGEIVGNLHVGILLARSGQHTRARPMFDRGAQLARVTGHAYAESLAAWGLAETADATGDYAAARAARLRELELLGAIGGNPHNAAMAHAHLANLAYRRSDVVEAEQEAAEARRLAVLSADTAYPQQVERAIRIERWADMDT